MKRNTYLLLIVAIVVVLFVFGYWFRYQGGLVVDLSQPTTTGSLPYNSGNIPTNTTNNQPPVNQTIPSSGGQTPTLGLVAQNPAEAYFVDAQNNVTLVQPDGQIVSVAAGQTTVLSSQVIGALHEASFSHDGQKILAVFGSSLSPQVSLFDVAQRTWQPLSYHFSNASWSPSDYQIAYFSKNTTTSVLTTVNLNDEKSKPQPLLALHEEDLKIRWVSQNQILLYEPGSGLNQSSLWSYDSKKKILSPIVADQPGLDVLWNPPTNQGLMFKSGRSGRGGSLVVIDSQGITIRPTNLTTLSQKCAFTTVTAQATQSTSTAATSSSSTLQTTILQSVINCAVPKDNSEFNVQTLPDGYNQKMFFTADDFYQMNLVTGNTQKIFSPSQSIDATNLKVINGIIFFINRLDSRLYALSLPAETATQ